MPLPIEITLGQMPKLVRNAVVNGAYTKIGVVRSVIAQDGLPSMAVVDFDDEQGVETKLMSGVGTPTHPGMTVRVRRDGGVIDPTWQIVDVLSGPRISFGEPIAALMAKPIIPGASFGGVYTESNTATADNPNAIADPGAPVKARVYLYVRSIVPGSYSAYQQRAKAIRVQGRTLGDTEWPDQFTDWPLSPANTLWSVLASSITASSTSISLTVPLDRVNELLVDQPAYWIVDGEVFLAIATNNGGGSVTLNVVAHNGIDDASLGQGFVTSALGRGLDGTDAASHTAGATVLLASASVAPGDLRPATDYEIRVAFVNASNQAGPWSDIVGVTTWEQPVPPAAPSHLVVAHLSSAFQAQWDPVVTDANGDYRSDVRRYFAVRHTAALAVGLSLAQVLSAGATQVADTPATVISVPATKGNGNFIGVAAVGSEGLTSNWSWASDTLAPPYPDPAGVTVDSVPGGIQVFVSQTAGSYNPNTGIYSSASAKSDPGFYEFVVYRADDDDGDPPSGYSEKGSFTGWNTFIPLPATDQTGYFKVVARDRSGNIPTHNAPNNVGFGAGWKYCNSLWPQDTFPQNGNFQLGNEDNTRPKFWNWNIYHPSEMSIDYVQNGGSFGNKAVRLRANWASGAAYNTTVAELYSTAVHPTRAHLPAHLTLWRKHSSLPPVGFFIFTTIYMDYYSDDAGTAYLASVPMFDDASETEDDDTTWAKASFGESQPAQDNGTPGVPNARSARIRIVLGLASSSGPWTPGTRDMYLDDLVLDWYEPGVSP